MSTTNLIAHFDQYLTLLKTLYPGISGLSVFDRDASLIWQDCDNPVDQEQLHSLAQNLLRSGIDSQIQHLLNGDIAELIKLKTPNGEATLVLSICGAQPDREAMQTIATDPAFTQLSEMLLADYQQNIDLAFKEDELIMMTDELTRRYEELNLIYKAEDQAVNIFHGRELLRQLVLNTSRFLNVDITYLYISGQIISMHKSRNDNPLFHCEALFECLRDVIHPLLEANPTPLVATSSGPGSRFKEKTTKAKTAAAARLPHLNHGRDAIKGVSSDGLITTALPAASGKAAIFTNSDSGAL